MLLQKPRELIDGTGKVLRRGHRQASGVRCVLSERCSFHQSQYCKLSDVSPELNGKVRNRRGSVSDESHGERPQASPPVRTVHSVWSLFPLQSWLSALPKRAEHWIILSRNIHLFHVLTTTNNHQSKFKFKSKPDSKNRMLLVENKLNRSQVYWTDGSCYRKWDQWTNRWWFLHEHHWWLGQQKQLCRRQTCSPLCRPHLQRILVPQATLQEHWKTRAFPKQ